MTAPKISEDEARKIVQWYMDRKRDKDDAEGLVRNREKIGKFYRYLNSGGGASWWLYAEVVGADAQDVMLIEFQTTPYAEESVIRRSWSSGRGFAAHGDEWKEISVDDFRKGIAPVLKALGLERKE